jgi:hypothetical protein
MQSLWNSWWQMGITLHRSPSSNWPKQIAQSSDTDAAAVPAPAVVDAVVDGRPPPPPLIEAGKEFRRGYVTLSSSSRIFLTRGVRCTAASRLQL